MPDRLLAAATHAHELRPRRLVGAAAAIGAVITAAVAWSPELYFAYDRPDLHLVLESLEAFIALLVVYLLVGRLRQTGELSDALLVFALAVLGGINMLSAVPVAIAGSSRETFATWGPLSLRLLAPAVMAVAAFTPAGRPWRRRPSAVIGAAAVTVVVGAVLGNILAPLLPPLVNVAPTEDPSRPTLNGHPVVLAAQLAGMVLFMAAAIGFVRRAERRGDELMSWLALWSTVNGIARVNYFLFPSLYSQYVYSGDVLRLASYLLLLVGAAREIRSYWRRAAELAVADERRKIARDLHDGLAQELSFVATQVRRLGRRPEVAGAQVQLERIASASQRALDESRRAIDYLAHPYDEPLGTLLTHAAEQVAGRAGARVRASTDAQVDVLPDVTEQLVRIVREAVTNATRHGEARTIDLTLKADDGLVVRIDDDGRGFDQTATDARQGFGLTSMRERAERIGGILVLRSQPGEGTTVEVRVPSRNQSES